MNSKPWPRNPAIYEINSWVWLSDLSTKYGTFIELGGVPPQEWDAIAAYGFDAVWLMGLWERCPAPVPVADWNPYMLEDFRRVLPDFHPQDYVGSPYRVQRYVVEELLGGPSGLAMARGELARRGMRLILDYVPSHVAPQQISMIAQTIGTIAGQCDGVRCALAPEAQCWGEIVDRVKHMYPAFLFIGEVYTNREWNLQRQGCDYCFDHRLLGFLAGGQAESVQQHLCAGTPDQSRMVRFIEGHHGPRAAVVFSAERQRAAALAVATLPGARLFHEGQLEGRKVRTPVCLGRRPYERPDKELNGFYQTLLKAIQEPLFHDGEWTLCEGTAGSDLLAWSWRKDKARCLVAVNFGENPARARIHVPWRDLHGETWRFDDVLSAAGYDREGGEVESLGLEVALEPWGIHLLQCHRSRQRLLASAA